jgi:FAD synthase
MMNIGFNPTVSEKTVDRSPFFWFRYRFVRSKIKVSILKYIRTEQNSILLIYLPNN